MHGPCICLYSRTIYLCTRVCLFPSFLAVLYMSQTAMPVYWWRDARSSGGYRLRCLREICSAFPRPRADHRRCALSSHPSEIPRLARHMSRVLHTTCSWCKEKQKECFLALMFYEIEGDQRNASNDERAPGPCWLDLCVNIFGRVYVMLCSLFFWYQNRAGTVYAVKGTLFLMLIIIKSNDV